MSVAEYAMLADQSYDLKANGETSIQPKFLRLPDNLRFTIKVVSRLFEMQLELGVGTTAWGNFKKAIEIRNRITHPKNASDIDISDDEIKTCKEVSGWFNGIVAKFIENLVRTATAIKNAELQENASRSINTSSQIAQTEDPGAADLPKPLG
jgi:hypothetical protein